MELKTNGNLNREATVMTSFEMVKYHSKQYPQDIPLRIEELAAHFDVETLAFSSLGRSLHTEYSFFKRDFKTKLIAKYQELLSAQKGGIPQLWKNEVWGFQFAEFIIDLNGKTTEPVVIEVHPPFNDYTDMNGFISSFKVFEATIKEQYPDVEILIENRCGSLYRGGKFVISKVKDIAALCDAIEQNGLSLKVAYDVPQIYTVHNAKTEEAYIKLLDDTKPLRSYIGGVHLWGKKPTGSGRLVAHSGDLNTYFSDSEIKNQFLNVFASCFDDGVARKMVLEVNSGNEDMLSIISDLRSIGIQFV